MSLLGARNNDFPCAQSAKIREQSYLGTSNKDLTKRFPLPLAMHPHHLFLFNSDQTKPLSHDGSGRGKTRAPCTRGSSSVPSNCFVYGQHECRGVAEEWKPCLKWAEKPFKSPSEEYCYYWARVAGAPLNSVAGKLKRGLESSAQGK